MELTAPQVEKLYGISVEMQHLWDQRGLLRCERGVKRGTGRTKLYDATGVYGLLLCDSLRKGDPAQGVPPLHYDVVKLLLAYVNTLSEVELSDAAASGKWLVYGHPSYPPKIVDFDAWDGDEVRCWFWVGQPVSQCWNRMLSGLSQEAVA